MTVVDEAALSSAIAALPGEEPRVVVSGNFATPHHLLGLVDGALPHWRAFVLNPQAGWPRRPGLVTETPFIGPGVRDDPTVVYLPMRLSLVPRLFETDRPPDAVVLHTSLPRHGRVSLGIEVNILPAAVEEVRRRGGLVIAQMNPQMPYTYGDAELPLEAVDLAIEVDTPLPSPPERPLDDASLAIGDTVSRYCADGGTLQLGIGQLPDAAAHSLRDRRRLGVWTEMLSDGVLALERAGVLDPDRPLISTFLFGSPDLYRWADGNDRLRMLRTEVVNSPTRIAAQPGMLSINTALQVDLFAQANASYVGTRIYSGFGGQPDFVSGALHSPGGHAVIAMRSWHAKSDSSNVVPLLWSPASSFQHSVVVTEHGAAEIFGRSQPDQASALIEHAAHPRVRDLLREAAAELGPA